ncbi:anion permease [Candidatus Skiveiella danica]|uniref:anion permease n=1 Tax=Candidatus Skiveiella danica TaxID=3386177 RepID=UPI0039B9C6F0
MALDASQKLGPMEGRRARHAGKGADAADVGWKQRMLLGPEMDLNATTTATIGPTLLILTGVLDWEDILKAKSACDTLVWFAALVMMATFLGNQ